MANPFTQYLQDTRAELRHVAWPTRTQTIIYTILVAALSVGIAVYLGFFDFLFTTGLARMLDALPGGAAPATQVQPAATGTPITVTQSPATKTSGTPTFTVQPVSGTGASVTTK